MKYIIVALLVLPALLMSLLPSAESGPEDSGVAESATRRLTVVELFTSQGCSSCPPADAVLAEIDATHDDVIALSFHVDYWNYLGWKDPFSSEHFSARQREYTAALNARTYTPQVVVNGRAEVIGSRASSVRQTIGRHGGLRLKNELSFTASTRGRKVAVRYDLEGADARYQVTALLVQPRATSAIKRGENRGQKLSYVNVVRAIAHQPAATTGQLILTAPEDVAPKELEVVLLVQDAETREVLGAVKQ